MLIVHSLCSARPEIVVAVEIEVTVARVVWTVWTSVVGVPARLAQPGASGPLRAQAAVASTSTTTAAVPAIAHGSRS